MRYLWLIFVLVLTPAFADERSADLILYHGVIWTVDQKTPTAEAIAIRKGKFAAVGSNEEIVKWKGEQTKVIDLQGMFVVPGFNDNHVHFASAAQFLEFNIMNVDSQEEFVRRTKEVVASLPNGEWIIGGFWGAYDQWTSGSAESKSRKPFVPDMSLIEEITARHPMWIRKFDDSEFAVNSAALKAANLNPDKPENGIEFVPDNSGKFTGLLKGKRVVEIFSKVVPAKFSYERRVRQTKRALEEIRKYGVSNVSDMSDDEQLKIYRDLHEKGELTVRVHFRPMLERWKELSDKGIQVGSGDEWIRLGALKGHIDGIMGNSTARFFEPYSHDPGNRGRWRVLMVDEKGEFVEGKFLKYMLDADRAGLQLSIHAIGDEANHLLMNYLQELQKQNGAKDRRFRLVHAQVARVEDIKRMGENMIVAEVQPFHLSDDMRWMEERIGKERCRGAYAFKSIQDSGAILSFGTDWPGTAASEYPINPMLGLYAAVTRKTINGQPPGGWFPEQRITIKDAIRAYTLNTAYANFEDTIKGSITPGKFADLTVLSKNLLQIGPAEILNTQVLYTIVNGEIVYQRGN